MQSPINSVDAQQRGVCVCVWRALEAFGPRLTVNSFKLLPRFLIFGHFISFRFVSLLLLRIFPRFSFGPFWYATQLDWLVQHHHHHHHANDDGAVDAVTESHFARHSLHWPTHSQLAMFIWSFEVVFRVGFQFPIELYSCPVAQSKNANLRVHCSA